MIQLFMLFFHILFLIIIFYKTRYNKTQTPFDKKSTNCIKGVCAIYVLFHHFGQNIGISSDFLAAVNGRLGDVAVGLFFMLSAYGLIKSFHKSGLKYLKKMILVNIPRLYLIYVSINSLYYLIFNIKTMKASEAILKIFGFDFLFSFERINGYAWFITTILIVYIIFILVYYCTNKLNKNVAPLLFSIIILLVYFIVKYDLIPISALYVRSLPCFIVGIIYATYQESINKFISNKYWIYFSFSIILSIVALIINDKNMLSILICLFTIIFSQRFVYANKITSFLGCISLEIYLLQLIFIQKFSAYLSKPMLYIFIVTSLTIISSLIFKTIEICIKKLINKIRKKTDS